jgi:dipeptidyl aminopeptidase/acylaminoacyl peptidase
MNRRIPYLLGSIIVGLAMTWWKQDPKMSISEQVTTQINETVPALAFKELTIPALRSRAYESQLGDLNQVSQNSNFTTHLTSYGSDGLIINALLTKPIGETPTGGWPAIVFVHGYIPPTLYRTQEKYVEYVNYLARNGFVVLKIDLRGHGSSEGEPSGSYYSSGYVIDTLNAYSALQKASFINPKAIGLWGHSMAGNIVLRSLAAQPDIPAAVIWAGAGFTYQDLRDYGLNDNSYRPPTPTRNPSATGQPASERQRLFNTYGQFDPSVSFWKEVTPTNYLSDLKGALQLHHAQDDSVVSSKYSENLNQLLNQTSVPHEFYTYQNGGHNLSGTSFSQAMQRTTDFYKKYLVTTE